MPGALKPPWVNKKEFYRLPFNYCDRWCERCDLKKVCKVYQENQKARKRAIKEGKDPDSPEFVFEEVRRNLQETMKLIYKKATEKGIDPAELKKVPEDYEEPPPPEIHLLYRLMTNFRSQLGRLLEELQIIPIDADESLVMEKVEILCFYQNLIVVKLARAFFSKFEEEKSGLDFLDDSKIQAFIVSNSLLAISEALVDLAEHKPLRLLKSKFAKLGKIALDLRKSVEEEFGIRNLL